MPPPTGQRPPAGAPAPAELVGRHIALDLVNTVAWRLAPGRSVDRIPDATALLTWSTSVGLVDDRPATPLGPDAERVLPVVRELRELLHEALQPLALGHDAPSAATTALWTRVLADLGGPRVSLAGVMPPAWAVASATVSDLPARLAVEAWDLLVQEDVRRLRQCRDDECGWLFLDRSRNGSRVWCSSADCGNRARARRHYARRTGLDRDAGART